MSQSQNSKKTTALSAVPMQLIQTLPSGFLASVTGTSGKTSTLNLLNAILEANHISTESCDSFGTHSTGFSFKRFCRSAIKRPLQAIIYTPKAQRGIATIKAMTMPALEKAGLDKPAQEIFHILEQPVTVAVSTETSVI
jgi:hypothetical protein